MQLPDCNLLMKKSIKSYRYFPKLLLPLLMTISFGQAIEASSKEELYKLLTKGNCRGCDLRNADLSHADLRSADLMGSNLSGANLNNAILDNANLESTDLRSATLYNASMKNVNLSGAKLKNTDLRNADLTDARIEINELKNSFWRNAKGIEVTSLSFEDIFQYGLEEIKFKNYTKAEYYFELALAIDNTKIEAYMALFNVQLILGKINNADITLQKVRSYYEKKEDYISLQKIDNVILEMNAQNKKINYGNGIGIDLVNAISSLSNQLRLTNFFIP